MVKPKEIGMVQTKAQTLHAVETAKGPKAPARANREGIRDAPTTTARGRANARNAPDAAAQRQARTRRRIEALRETRELRAALGSELSVEERAMWLGDALT